MVFTQLTGNKGVQVVVSVTRDAYISPLECTESIWLPNAENTKFQQVFRGESFLRLLFTAAYVAVNVALQT